MLYGKWRPRGFDEVAGQDHIVRTLRNALASGQVAHAYLFSGPRGTGKTTTARILARSLNCANLVDGDPCNACPSCRAILAGNALDLIEMDAASNRGIEDIRELREKIAFAPSDLTKKVYLLDEVHMLTDGAFNALLKTLEEPPPHAVFILATTDLHKVPATIISRCQRYDFHRVPNEAIIHRLQFICEQEGFAVPREGLLAIAVQSRGGLRDAITMLEQVTARYGTSPTADDVRAAMRQVSDTRVAGLVGAILADDLGAALQIARSVADDGIDIARFTRAAIDLMREIIPEALKRESPAGHPLARLIADARGRSDGVRLLAAAIAELAKADFRLDPASPIPLEVACAAVILSGGLPAPRAQPIMAGAPAGTTPAAARPAAAGPDWFPRSSAIPSAFLRSGEGTLDGMKIGFSNRDHLPEPTPLGGRAVRAAANTLENFVLFVALALTANAAGLGDEATLGAQVFFWARLVYLPVYWAGITYVRSLVWGVGIAGLAMMLFALI